MTKTLRIAKLELSILFYSPIAWLLLIVFILQCGYAYTSTIEDIVTYAEINPLYWQTSQTFFTQVIFGTNQPGISPGIVSNLYLYLPLMTMGLISREFSSGTITLLYSSPVHIRQIIFGKFAAMMGFNFLLTLIVGIISFFGFVHIEHADYGLLLSQLLGIYILLAAFSAIGLFMSCLTTYQVIAAISTFITFGLLNYIGGFWQGIDFVRDLTYFLSMGGRTANLLNGLISTKDLIYFMVIVYLFLAFSIVRLQSGRQQASALSVAGKYLLIFFVALAVGYTSSRPGFIGYYDATSTKTNTLTEHSQQILKEMGDKPITITSYVNYLDAGLYRYGSPEARNAFLAHWEPYTRFKPDINFKYVYFYDSTMDGALRFNFPEKSVKDMAEMYANANKINLAKFKTPTEIAKIIDLRPELNQFVMEVAYNEKKDFLRVYNDGTVYPDEANTMAVFKRFMVKRPVIVFWQGELERNTRKMDDRAYTSFTTNIANRFALVNQGFDIKEITAEDEIPVNTSCLVIADPRTGFNNKGLAKIQNFISTGGNLLIAGEPGKQEILAPILSQLGVKMTGGIIVQASKRFFPDFVLPKITEAAANFTPQLKEYFNLHMKVSMPGVAGLNFDTASQFQVSPLLVTDGSLTWNKVNKLDLDSADIVFAPQNGDRKDSMITALGMTRKIKGKEQRIIVTGDADFLSNGELGRGNLSTANAIFNPALFSWFTHGEFPINVTRPQSKEKHFYLSLRGLFILRLFLLGILPGLLLIVGSVLLIRRKRK